MCALCGTLGGKDHWIEPLAREGVYVRFADPAARRRERTRLVAEANVILALFGLSMEDWQSGSYLLRTPTGKTELVADIAALWPTAERLAGRLLDPLEAQTLARREGRRG